VVLEKEIARTKKSALPNIIKRKNEQYLSRVPRWLQSNYKSICSSAYNKDTIMTPEMMTAKEDPKTESMAVMAEMTCGECDQMHTELCLHQCIYKVLFDDCRTRD